MSKLPIGPSPDWLKFKNPPAPAEKRESVSLIGRRMWAQHSGAGVMAITEVACTRFGYRCLG